jgi:hypothetical protein
MSRIGVGIQTPESEVNNNEIRLELRQDGNTVIVYNVNNDWEEVDVVGFRVENDRLVLVRYADIEDKNYRTNKYGQIEEVKE